MIMILQFDRLNGITEGPDRKCIYFETDSLFFQNFLLQVGSSKHFHLGFIPNFVLESNQVTFHSLARKA